jgi:uncharacterized protein YdeI (YjbR/CyaY-like superfamily)
MAIKLGETLDVAERRQWRAWLRRNHASAQEIWLVFHSRESGKPSLPYNDAVEEALCFGWIDSTVKKLGPDSRAQRFAPRRPASPFSEMNKVRLRRLAEQGKLAAAGRAAAGGVLDEPFVIPKDILKALKADTETWRNFQSYPESYQRIRVGWIEGARLRPEVFEQRLRYLLKMTAQNKRFGMVQ